MLQSNRDYFLYSQKFLSFENNDINYHDSEIYALLIKANNYKNYTELIINFDKNLANPNSFLRNLKLLKEGNPLQYILEEANFLGFDLYVDHNVLIPRVETEELVLETIKIIKEDKMNVSNIADVCTGSACIALSMKNEFKDATVYALDKYDNVIEIARRNIDKYKKDIILLKGDKLEPLIKRNIKVDVLISNPPYIENIKDIDKKVLNYEPQYAYLVNDGTSFYEDYFSKFKLVMNKKFLMAFEINYDQEEKLKFLIKKYFNPAELNYFFKKDINGKTRFLFIKGE